MALFGLMRVVMWLTPTISLIPAIGRMVVLGLRCACSRLLSLASPRQAMGAYLSQPTLHNEAEDGEVPSSA